MKNLCIMSLYILIMLILFSSCSNNNTKKEHLIVNTDFLTYEAENINAYTVDENGLLYVSGILTYDNEHQDTINNSSEHNSHDTSILNNKHAIYLHKYDLDGILIYSHIFENIGTFNSMTVKENTVYFTTSGYNEDGPCMILHSYDIEADKLERIKEMNFFDNIKQLIYKENRIYILGNKENPKNLVDSEHTDRNGILVYYSLNDNELYKLEIQYPISISLDESETLIIYSYIENEGYGLHEYILEKDLIKLLKIINIENIDYFALCDQGKKLIYNYNNNISGLLVSPLSATEETAEITTDSAIPSLGIHNVKGQIYYMTSTRKLARLSLNKIKKDNRSIRYITAGYQPDAPFGCGYNMIKTELEEEGFALKLLAQDKDYDLCVMNSSSYTSYSIRENAVYYPLNDVEGIEQYLEECFPYVRDAAMDKEGNIWMLPISVDIPGLLVNENNLAYEKINLKNNITYEEFYQLQDTMTEALYEKTSLNSYAIYLSFFAQFFNKPKDINYDAFIKTLRLFQNYNSQIPNNMKALDYNSDFLYSYVKQASYYRTIINLLHDEQALRVYSLPKNRAADTNIGTCTFLMVNAYSDNREVALEYISDWISYCLSQEEVPYHFKDIPSDASPLRKSIYDLYKNGEISFYIDRDVYVNGFFDVVENGSNITDFIEETKKKLDLYFYE